MPVLTFDPLVHLKQTQLLSYGPGRDSCMNKCTFFQDTQDFQLEVF